jgi:hypothetical protein
MRMLHADLQATIIKVEAVEMAVPVHSNQEIDSNVAAKDSQQSY